MDFYFLPERYINALKNIPTDKLYELRLRANFPISLNYANKFAYLCDEGITMFIDKAIVCSDTDIEYVINTVTERSIYAFNESIKRGYITTRNGIRIGLAGECVFTDGQVQTIKNFTSLNVRIPHEILGCADNAYRNIMTDKLNNTLIIAPPACGKTTILKDLARLINQDTNISSILIIDERGEFSLINGQKIDKIKYSDKLYAFTLGIRSLSPQVVITDELISESDWKCVAAAAFSGVKIIATCHGENLDSITSKQFFINGVFERYIILENKIFCGEICKVYDKDFNLL